MHTGKGKANAQLSCFLGARATGTSLSFYTCLWNYPGTLARQPPPSPGWPGPVSNLFRSGGHCHYLFCSPSHISHSSFSIQVSHISGKTPSKLRLSYGNGIARGIPVLGTGHGRLPPPHGGRVLAPGVPLVGIPGGRHVRAEDATVPAKTVPVPALRGLRWMGWRACRHGGARIC